MTMRPATGSNTPQTLESAGVSGSEAAEEEEEVVGCPSGAAGWRRGGGGEEAEVGEEPGAREARVSGAEAVEMEAAREVEEGAQGVGRGEHRGGGVGHGTVVEFERVWRVLRGVPAREGEGSRGAGPEERAEFETKRLMPGLFCGTRQDDGRFELFTLCAPCAWRAACFGCRHVHGWSMVNCERMNGIAYMAPIANMGWTQ